MIAALIWIVGAVRRARASKSDRGLARAITAIKAEQYDLNPALRFRQRIPKVGRL